MPAFITGWRDGTGWTRSTLVIALTMIGYGDLAPNTLITGLCGRNDVMLLRPLFDVVRRVRGWELRGAHDETLAQLRRLVYRPKSYKGLTRIFCAITA